MDKTVAKALNVLEVLAQNDKPMSVTEVGNACNLTRSNAHRLLVTLSETGYVVQQPASRRYKITLKLWSLGATLVERIDLKEAAGPILRDLNEITGETTHLSVRNGYEVIYIDKLDAKHAVRTFTHIGGRAPGYCVATGKAILAFQDESVIAVACDAIVQFTPATITDPVELRRNLERVRKTGYAVNYGEWRGGAYGLAVPIRGADGQVDTAIGISAPADRMSNERIDELSPTLIRLGAQLSKELGDLDADIA